jgi:hypothetical protein
MSKKTKSFPTAETSTSTCTCGDVAICTCGNVLTGQALISNIRGVIADDEAEIALYLDSEQHKKHVAYLRSRVRRARLFLIVKEAEAALWQEMAA